MCQFKCCRAINLGFVHETLALVIEHDPGHHTRIDHVVRSQLLHLLSQFGWSLRGLVAEPALLQLVVRPHLRWQARREGCQPTLAHVWEIRLAGFVYASTSSSVSSMPAAMSKRSRTVTPSINKQLISLLSRTLLFSDKLYSATG